MKPAHRMTGNQRCTALPGCDAASDELVDRPPDNRQHLFTVLGVDEVLELLPLAHGVATVTWLLLLGEVAARHEVEESEDAGAFLLAPIALELLIDREAKGQVAQAVPHLFSELHGSGPFYGLSQRRRSSAMTYS